MITSMNSYTVVFAISKEEWKLHARTMPRTSAEFKIEAISAKYAIKEAIFKCRTVSQYTNIIVTRHIVVVRKTLSEYVQALEAHKTALQRLVEDIEEPTEITEFDI